MLNKATLIGNLGADPEIRHTGKGTAVASFTLATTEYRKDEDGNRNDATEWHNIVAWDKLADIAGQYLVKGSKVYIEGKIQTRKWQDNDGNNRYTTEIIARDIKMLSPKNEQPQQPQQHRQHKQQGQGSHNGTGPDVPF